MNGRFALLSMLLIRPYVKSHAYKYSVMLACPASFFKKDSRQAGMKDNGVLLINSFEKMEQWAKRKDIHRLELNVVTHNEAAVALYRKVGFEIEGKKKHSLLINNTYADEYWMV